MYKAYLRAKALTSVVLVSVGLAAGCQDAESDTPPGDVEDVEGVSSPLAAATGVALWPNGNVKICWINAGLEAEKNRLRTAIERSWGDNSGLTFEWPTTANTTCPGSGETVAPEYMPIFLFQTTGAGGACAFGVNGRQDKSLCGGSRQCQCTIYTATFSPILLEFGAIHEVGHGLGFIHEHQRPDRPANLPSTCTDPTAISNPSVWTDSNHESHGNYVIGSGTLTTPYDGGSMMNYCYDPDNDGVQGDVRVNVGLQYPELSPFDKLGVEMFYPFSPNRRPVPANGIGDASGTNFIVRSDVPTTLQTDWTSRGALASFFSNPAWRWRTGPSLEFQEQFSTSLTPAVTISGTKVVEVQVNDVLGRQHVWTRSTLQGDEALYMGVMLTANNLLM